MKNFQIIKINEDSSIKVEYLKTNYIDITNPGNLKGLDLLTHITNTIDEFQRESDFLDPEPGTLETLELIPVESGPTQIIASVIQVVPEIEINTVNE